MRNFQTGNITHLQKTDASWNQWHMGGVFSVYEITICYVESTFPKLGNAAQIDKERYFEWLVMKIVFLLENEKRFRFPKEDA